MWSSPELMTSASHERPFMTDSPHGPSTVHGRLSLGAVHHLMIARASLPVRR